MNFKYLIVYFINFCIIGINQAQKNDTWIFGAQVISCDSLQIDTGIFKITGGNLMTFNDTLNITRVKNSLSIDKCLVNMCDDQGNLLFYSNGSKIFNYTHHLIENGDSLNYNEEYNAYDSGYYAVQHNGRMAEAMMAFRHPKNPNQYYLVYVYLDYLDAHFSQVRYALLDMSLNNGLGKVLKKEIILDSAQFFNPTLAACRHANGRDWWIVVPRQDSTNCYLKLLLDTSGIHLQPSTLCEGWIRSNTDAYTSSRYSPDGKKYAIVNQRGVELYDFDRCIGSFFNRKYAEYPYGDTAFNFVFYPQMNLCFSPNSQYLYLVYDERIYQFDTKALDFQKSIVRVATYDSTKMGWFPVTFNVPQIAPNGKIYISSAATTYYLHSIEKPNEKGLACQVRQHSVRLKTVNGTVPHFPFYSLGADSSGCVRSMVSNISEPGYSIYPNPARDYLQITPPLWRPQDYQIYNLLGKKMLSGTTTKEIDVSSLYSGTYFLYIGGEIDHRTVQKFEIIR